MLVPRMPQGYKEPEWVVSCKQCRFSRAVSLDNGDIVRHPKHTLTCVLCRSTVHSKATCNDAKRKES